MLKSRIRLPDRIWKKPPCQSPFLFSHPLHPQVALHGDPATVRGASMLLEHRDGSVRAGALRTLSWVARVGDAEVMAKVRRGARGRRTYADFGVSLE